MDFGLPPELPLDRLQAPFDAASEALVRLDERLRMSPVADAYVARTHFRDACAALWREGGFVDLEDLVLNDARMDARSPTHELVRAHGVLIARRQIAERAPDWALTKRGMASLRGGSSFAACETSGREDEEDDPPDFSPDDSADENPFAEIDALLARTSGDRAGAPTREELGLVYDADWDEAARLGEWRARVEETRALPPLMAAARAFDAWAEIEPLQRQSWLGPLLVAALLRARGKTRHHLAALHVGLRGVRHRTRPDGDLASRMLAFGHLIQSLAEAEMRELDRLTLAREILLRKCKGKRAHSKLPRLAEFCLASPIISAPLVAKELEVSKQAATTMIGELSSNLRELTGRGRYRAWAVI